MKIIPTSIGWKIRLFAMLGALLVMSSYASADDNVSWGQHPDLASVEMALKGHSIQVVVANTSGTPKVLFRMGLDPDAFVIIDYVDATGTFVPLDYHPDPSERGSGSITRPFLPKGDTYSFNLTPEEISQVKVHPVVCRFVVFDRPSKRKYFVKSNPQMLDVKP